MAAEEIVNCGCGGKPKLTHKKWINQTPADIEWDILCPKCGLIIEDFPTQPEAISAWNLELTGNAERGNRE